MNKPTIAVVDDEADILSLYEGLLSDDYQVLPFLSPKLFLESLRKNSKIDLLITDLKMPSMDGLEMIRQSQQLGHRFPFLLLSGHLDKQKALEAVDLGAFRILEKPTDLEILSEAIDQLLVEHEIHSVRNEIRGITSQLRELYTSIRVILLQHIPEELMDRLVVETDGQGRVKKKMGFDELLENLESRLDHLLGSEKMLLDLKNNNLNGSRKK